ncbi:MAG: amino acid ABC transporter permease [Propionibacteriaceae bacterium]|nr:amino acid ABC transporter permease [Propionibacteriaceae bacterium]
MTQNEAQVPQDIPDDGTIAGVTASSPTPVKDVPRYSPFHFRLSRALLTLTGFALMGILVYGFITSPNLEWPVFFRYLFYPQVINGVYMTLLLTAISMIVGTILGIVAALAKMSDVHGFRLIANAYVWIFRGTPLLVQVIIAFNLSLFLPVINLGFVQLNTNSVMTPFFSAAIALTLNEGAYMSEYIRGAILGVDPGQKEAALSQGMSSTRAMQRIVLPQAIPTLIPILGNQTISMLKATSIVSVIAAAELLTQVTVIYHQNYFVIELLLVACAWYITMVSILSVIQYYIERELASRVHDRGPRESLRTKIQDNLRFGRRTPPALSNPIP